MASDKSERELLEEISMKLDRLTALQTIQGKELDAQIAILTRMGFSSTEIGSIIGRHPDSVRRRRSKKQKSKTSQPSAPGTI